MKEMEADSPKVNM